MTLDVVMAGASGLLGRTLAAELTARGHQVTRLVRRPAGPDESTWDPYAGSVDRDLVGSADVVVNLAGSPLIGNPHSRKWAQSVRQSRVTTTRLLAELMAAADQPPAYLAGNGIGYYGDHGDEVVTEESDSRGDSLLASVTQDWQAATDPAAEAGARVCVLRTSPVLDRASAPMKQLALLFKLGLGAKLGDGGQYFPIISLRDWVNAVAFLAEHDSISGPVNLCCPTTPTNAEFTRAMAAAVHRPAFLAAPAFVLRPAAGSMAPELLGSVRARPAALLDAGFAFLDPDVDAVVAAGLSS
ncbi:MAG: TIGR01777 family oxidoreductase [Nocardioides sp.]|uniref:TIGR01777 family oxidoreductase n=1 Tax=Nocardioides sp. TaxID=35761 RepID=UPI0039E373E7